MLSSFKSLVALLLVFSDYQLSQSANYPSSIRLIQNAADFLHVAMDAITTNQIKTLFDILTTTEDRKKVIGFQDYNEMNTKLPSARAKVRYLKSIIRNHDFDLDSFDAHDYHPSATAFVFDDTQTIIVEIMWDRYWNGTRCDPSFDPVAINWKAVGKLKDLRGLSLNGLSLQISMSDLERLPSSLKKLDIGRNHWKEFGGNLELYRLPDGLEEFEAMDCPGMDGSLNLFAPHSKLILIDLQNNEFEKILNWQAPPAGFQQIILDQFVMYKDSIQLALYKELHHETCDGLCL